MSIEDEYHAEQRANALENEAERMVATRDVERRTYEALAEIEKHSAPEPEASPPHKAETPTLASLWGSVPNHPGAEQVEPVAAWEWRCERGHKGLIYRTPEDLSEPAICEHCYLTDKSVVNTMYHPLSYTSPPTETPASEPWGTPSNTGRPATSKYGRSRG